MMAERLFSLPSYKKSARQQCTVPFLWEEKPGTPKKNWRPEAVLVHSVRPPVKLITMVPFKWEEKPGTPLPCLSHPQEKPLLLLEDSPALPLPPAKLVGFVSSLGYSQCSSSVKIRGKLRNMFSRRRNHNSEKENDSASKEDEETRDEKAAIKGEEETLNLDIEATDFDKNESFGSAQCLLANCCISKEIVTNAIPVHQHIVNEENIDTQYEIPTSPASETESYFSSSVNGSSSLTGSSFMECFFPQFSPDSGYLDEVHSDEENPRKGNIVKRTPTLGELIRVSCRGCRRSSLHVKKRNPSLEFMKGFGRCITGTGSEAGALHAV